MRQLQGRTKKKEDLDRELAHAKTNLKKIEKLVQSLRARKDELSAQIEECGEMHHAQQLEACKEKLMWLKENFPIEFELAMLSRDGATDEEVSEKNKSSLLERKEYLVAVLQDLRQNQNLESVVATKAEQLTILRNEARLQSTELRCRQAAEINWRSILSGAATLTARQLLDHCGTIRNQVLPVALEDEDEEDTIKRRMEALGTAELVETWLSTVTNSEDTDVAPELAAFLEALASESEIMETELQAKLQNIEEQTATLGKLVAVKGNAEVHAVEKELQKTVDEIIRSESAEQERRAKFEKKHARLTEMAYKREVPVVNNLDDWKSVLCVGRPEERSGFIQCIMRAESIVVERMNMWAEAGEVDLSAEEARRTLSETEARLRESSEKLKSETARVEDLEKECCAVMEKRFEEVEEQNNPLKLQRQMLESLDDEIHRAEQSVRDSAERKVRERHTKQRELLLKLTQKKNDVNELVREEKELETQMGALRKNYEVKLHHTQTVAAPIEMKYSSIKTPPRPQHPPTVERQPQQQQQKRKARSPPPPAVTLEEMDDDEYEQLERQAEQEVPVPRVVQEIPAEVQLFGPSSPMIPAQEAIKELKRVNALVQEGTWVWKKLKNGHGKRRLRLAADLSRTEIRKEGKKVAEDFIRSDHMVKIVKGKPDPSTSSYPFIVLLRDTRLEFTTATPRETADWCTVLSLLIKHRASLFFLKYNLRHLLQ
eukprot:TRINITY_DN3912_c0_g1_i3.p1 TRINITY_DN3912_c0_g1~~TRINITY_DN3912_c0_g1_i3.p1  ORF type:complete len:717 (+),score=209.68 TRINITY_DN3912_c0_g1_i3:1933-4083(+)